MCLVPPRAVFPMPVLQLKFPHLKLTADYLWGTCTSTNLGLNPPSYLLPNRFFVWTPYLIELHHSPPNRPGHNYGNYPSSLPPQALPSAQSPWIPPLCCLHSSSCTHCPFLAPNLIISSWLAATIPKWPLPPSVCLSPTVFQTVTRELFLGKPVWSWDSSAWNAPFAAILPQRNCPDWPMLTPLAMSCCPVLIVYTCFLGGTSAFPASWPLHMLFPGPFVARLGQRSFGHCWAPWF